MPVIERLLAVVPNRAAILPLAPPPEHPHGRLTVKPITEMRYVFQPQIIAAFLLSAFTHGQHPTFLKPANGANPQLPSGHLHGT